MITAELRGRIPYLERVIYAPRAPAYAISRYYREKTDYKTAFNPQPAISSCGLHSVIKSHTAGSRAARDNNGLRQRGGQLLCAGIKTRVLRRHCLMQLECQPAVSSVNICRHCPALNRDQIAPGIRLAQMNFARTISISNSFEPLMFARRMVFSVL